LAVPFGLATPILAQVPNSNEQSTSLNDWVQDARDDATQNAIQFSFDHLALTPSYIAWGNTINTDNLQTATWQRDYSASSAWFYANQLSDTEAAIESARAKAIDLQSQLAQARATIGAPQSGSARIGEIESNLKQVNSTLSQATVDKSYLEFRLVIAKSDLQQAEANMGSARRGLFYFNEVAPRYNSTIDFTSEHLPLLFMGREAYDLMTNPVNGVQTADAGSRTIDLTLNAMSYLGRNAFWAETTVPLAVGFDGAVNSVRTNYNAFEHQNESVNLAFGGSLSHLNLGDLQNYAHAGEFHDHYGSNSIGSPNAPLFVSTNWSSVDGITSDKFDTRSSYRFNGLDSPSGHVLTGIGTVFRERKEQHDPFQFDPILNTLNIFNPNESMNTNETTWRNETIHDTFNGAMVNQNIQRAAEFNPPPSISIQVMPSASQLYDQDILKRPPSTFIPPPSPLRPEPNTFSNDNREGDSPPQVKGVLMPANVTTRPVDVQKFLGD
jgi:hypothetical protein